MTAILDEGILEGFADRLRERGVPTITAAQPGLDDRAMQQAAAQLGLRLPVEATTWWGWRNGVPSATPAASREIAPGRLWLPLEEALTECVRIRHMIADAFARTPTDTRPIEAIWSSKWIPLIQYEGLYVIDTDVPEDAPCPVRIYWFYEPEAPPDLASVGELVLLWTEAIDRGAWRYEPSTAQWCVEDSILDQWPGAKRGLV